MSGRPRRAVPSAPRTPRFRPLHAVADGPLARLDERAGALAGLYPIHLALAALVVGLLAGPRAPAVVVIAALAGLAAVAQTLRGRAVLALPRPEAEDPELAGVRTGTPPPAILVPAMRAAVAAGAAAVAVVAGALVAEERLRALDASALRPVAHAEASGFVEDAPRTRARGTRVFPLRLTAPDHANGETVLVRALARVKLPGLRTGDEVRVRGKLRELTSFESFERRRGVHAVVEADAVAVIGRSGAPLDAVRRRAEDALGRGLPPEQAALARGMVLGQDAALPEDLRDALRDAGLSHLVAASGQNVMLLAALVLGLLTLLGLPLHARLAAALVAVLLYVPLAGAGPSIQRAGVMGAAGLVAALASRPAARGHALLLAAAVTLALNPRAAEDPGWQLSFAAVIAILALHQPLRRRLAGEHDDEHAAPDPPTVSRRLAATWRRREPDTDAGERRRGLPGPLAEAVALTVSATVGTAPLLSLHFGELSLVSLPANVLAVPAVAPVMWLGTVAAVCGGEVATVLNHVAAYPLAYLAWLGRTAAAVPHASVGAQLPGPLAALAAYALVAAAALALGRPAVRARLRLPPRTCLPLAVLVVAAVGLVLPRPVSPPAGPTLSQLDVGQGNAVLVQDGEHAILFDTGPAGAPLVRELRASGVQRLDAVIVSHSATDHAGGLPALLQALPVGVVVDGRGAGLDAGGEGAGARFEGLPPSQPRATAAAGQRLRAGRLTVDIVWPPPGDARLGDPNDTAAVALVRAPGGTALLTADAESNVTLPLDLPHVDVLQVAHHGSEDAGLPALLERLRPRTALIPVGENTYGHPRAQTVRALERAVPDVRRTDEDGTVRIALGGAP